MDESAGEAAPVAVQVYWRPGCPYCRRLRRALRRYRIEAQWHNIWNDERARRFVREANGGAETVPTVRIGRTMLTNPSGAPIAALMPARPPNLSRPSATGRPGSWFARLLGR